MSLKVKFVVSSGPPICSPQGEQMLTLEALRKSGVFHSKKKRGGILDTASSVFQGTCRSRAWLSSASYEGGPSGPRNCMVTVPPKFPFSLALWT